MFGENLCCQDFESLGNRLSRLRVFWQLVETVMQYEMYIHLTKQIITTFYIVFGKNLCCQDFASLGNRLSRLSVFWQLVETVMQYEMYII